MSLRVIRALYYLLPKGLRTLVPGKVLAPASYLSRDLEHNIFYCLNIPSVFFGRGLQKLECDQSVNRITGNPKQAETQPRERLSLREGNRI